MQKQDFYGTYRGVTFTDASVIRCGEMQVDIDAKHITWFIATGLDVQKDWISMWCVRELSALEIAAEFMEGAPIDDFGVSGIALGDSGVRLLFLSYEEEGPQVIVRGLMAEEAFGPSFLFAPSQVEAGLFEQAIQRLEKQLGKPGDLPLIRHGGQAPGSSNDG